MSEPAVPISRSALLDNVVVAATITARSLKLIVVDIKHLDDIFCRNCLYCRNRERINFLKIVFFLSLRRTRKNCTCCPAVSAVLKQSYSRPMHSCVKRDMLD